MPTAKRAPAKKAATKAAKKTVVKRATAKRAPAKKADGPLGKKGRYHVKVEMNGEVFEGLTDTLARSIEALKPALLSTKVIITADLPKAAQLFTDVMMIPRARRLFSNTMAADLYEKRIKMALGDFNNG